MAKKLDRYRDKRDPARTNEPFGAEPLRSPQRSTRAGRFVVHLHDATRAHYDLRLEVGGVLLSFAVPRGPSLDPAEKRLAVHTENHPLDYLEFEAVIPEGNYGAGPMILWDTGTVHFLETSAEEGMQKGKLDFVLGGFKLRGRYALVQTGKRSEREADARNWLLLKKADAHSKPGVDIVDLDPRSVLSGLEITELANAERVEAALVAMAKQRGAKSPSPRASELIPMRCAEDGANLDDPRAIYELKLDGVRILAERGDEHVALRYRTQRNTTASYPEIVRALRALPARRFVLDGEIIAFDAQGKPNFARLARRIHASTPADVRNVMREIPVVYAVFDLLALDDLDLRKLPLHARKDLLSQLVRGRGFVRALDHFDGNGRTLVAFCAEQGLEGVIVKAADSPYVSGPNRSSHWVKHKLLRHDDFVITGFTAGRGARNRLGALELASYVGDALIARGRVGSGLDDAAVSDLRDKLDPLVVEQSAATGTFTPAPGVRTFVAPKLIASVEYSGFTPDGHLRHPVFRGLRDDVAPEACSAAPADEHEEAAARHAAANGGKAAGKPGLRIQLTNRDKVFWPNEGITKGDLCDYYASIAPTLLPYLRDRPVLMVRYPDGIAGKHFYQWNAPAGMPSFVQAHVIHSEDHDRDIAFVRVDDIDALLYVANSGCIPLHVLAGRFSDLERCDFLTIDFDLGDAPLASAIVLARALRDFLDELGLPGYPKTSGQTGLHVLVPMGGASFGTAKTLATLLGSLLHSRHPEISTIERSRRARRENAVYIDTGQTGRSRAIVAPYSVRAYPGATVSTPLRWDEVGRALTPGRFDLSTVPARVAELGDPMQAMLDEQPDIASVVARLAEHVTTASKQRR